MYRAGTVLAAGIASDMDHFENELVLAPTREQAKRVDRSETLEQIADRHESFVVAPRASVRC